MKILAVDTATRTCSVAIAEGDHIRFEITVDHARTHARHLMSLIRMALDHTGSAINSFDGFAVTTGPGSFTGLRIGISTIKGLALAAGKPVVGVCSLDALAHPFAGTPGLVCPFIDARKSEVYTAAFRWKVDRFETVFPPLVISPDKAVAELYGPCLFVGNGAEFYRQRIEALLGENAIFASPPLNVIKASVIAYLGSLRLKQKTQPFASIEPFYIRRSDAEMYRKKREITGCC